MNFNYAEPACQSNASLWDGLSAFCIMQALVVKEVSDYHTNGPIHAILDNGVTLWCQTSSVNEILICLCEGSQEKLFQLFWATNEWRLRHF